MKLTRAEIQMCPECGAELGDNRSIWDWGCECRAELYLAHAHWGYHAPDVGGVVREMRDRVDLYDITQSEADRLRGWIDRLSPERKDGEG